MVGHLNGSTMVGHLSNSVLLYNDLLQKDREVVGRFLDWYTDYAEREQQVESNYTLKPVLGQVKKMTNLFTTKQDIPSDMWGDQKTQYHFKMWASGY